MNIEEVKELIKMIDESDLALFELKQGDFSLKMDKSQTRSSEVKELVKQEPASQKESVVNNTISVQEAKVEIKEEIIDENLFIVKSPIVGTFYGSSSPDKDPYVHEGKKVKQGDVLCIIEAMKLMNEIESEINGEIVEVMVESESMVEYGQTLFKIRRA